MSNVDPNLATATGATASKDGTNVDVDDESKNRTDVKDKAAEQGKVENDTSKTEGIDNQKQTDEFIATTDVAMISKLKNWIPQSGDTVLYSRALHAEFVKGHSDSLAREQCYVPIFETAATETSETKSATSVPASKNVTFTGDSKQQQGTQTIPGGGGATLTRSPQLLQIKSMAAKQKLTKVYKKILLGKRTLWLWTLRKMGWVLQSLPLLMTRYQPTNVWIFPMKSIHSG